jgi:very-short-patch-repair endonuclease
MARTPKRIRLAQSIRKAKVPAEALLWRVLRNRTLAGFKFRRQHPIGSYVVDFACLAYKLIVEVNGVSHLEPKNDEVRSIFLKEDGWCVLRFWNTEIYDDLEAVQETIYRKCMPLSQPK